MQMAQVQGAPSLPQVNLLPPHLRTKRKLAVVRRWLALALLLVVLFVIAGSAAVAWEGQAADSELVEVQDANDALVLEQTKYAEVPIVLRNLAAHQEARTLAMSTQMLWSPYLAAIASATPLEASLDTITVGQDTVWTGSTTVSNGPLDTPGTVGQVSLSGQALTLTAVSDWQDGLTELKGLADVQFSSIEVSDDGGGVYYTVNATFMLTPDAFANQFATEQ